jgi:hypothetical protein
LQQFISRKTLDLLLLIRRSIAFLTERDIGQIRLGLAAAAVATMTTTASTIIIATTTSSSTTSSSTSTASSCLFVVKASRTLMSRGSVRGGRWRHDSGRRANSLRRSVAPCTCRSSTRHVLCCFLKKNVKGALDTAMNLKQNDSVNSSLYFYIDEAIIDGQ